MLDSIDELLARCGTDKSRILMAQVFIKDLAHFPAFNEARRRRRYPAPGAVLVTRVGSVTAAGAGAAQVWDAWTAEGNAPPRATVQAPLADPKWLLEIVVTAAVPAKL